MKLMSYILSFLFVTQALAADSSNLKETLDQHHYFITVEWDQKNQSVLDSQNTKFIQALQAKITSGEISEEAILSYLKQEMSPEEIAALKIAIANALKSGRYESVTSLLQEVSTQSYQTGAHWSPVKTTLLVAGGVALSLFVLYTWFIHNQLECDGFYDCHGGE